LFNARWLAKEFKTKEETIIWDLKLLVDFGLLKSVKPDNKVIYYRLDMEL